MPSRRSHSPPPQPDLFAAASQAAGQGRTVVAVAPAGDAALSKAQQTFNRLTEKIRRLRDELAMWQAYGDKQRSFIAAKIEPLEREIRAAKIDLLRLVDQLLRATGQPRLGKLQRRKLRGLLCTVAGDVLGDTPDEEVEALFDRHAGRSWEDEQASELAQAEAFFGAVLGDDAVEGHGAKSFDDFARHMADKMAEQAQQHDRQREAARRDGPKGKRAAAAAARKEQAQREASQSVREVFRRLASALHPDRETDAAERERKTRLMQQANEAYARDDLLALLTLQLELDHIDEAHLAGLPDKRVELYNHVLRDQVRALEQEIDAATLPWRQVANLPPLIKLESTALVDIAVQRDLAAMQRLLREIRGDTAMLADPQRRSAAIAAMPAHFGREVDDDAELEAIFANIDAMIGSRPDPGRPRRRRRR